MTKKNGICILISAFVMMLLPWAAAVLVDGAWGMAVCFLLFFAVDPITAIAVGIFSGRNLKASWFQPILSALLFLLGAWLFFDMGDPAFLVYAAVYLVLGAAAMFITAFFSRKKER